ncbi:MAG: hypothetical protein EBS20_05865 [Actinobacteria bacterium]|nr:hypothetical protein [Actinomycetota bacterium]
MTELQVVHGDHTGRGPPQRCRPATMVHDVGRSCGVGQRSVLVHDAGRPTRHRPSGNRQMMHAEFGASGRKIGTEMHGEIHGHVVGGNTCHADQLTYQILLRPADATRRTPGQIHGDLHDIIIVTSHR